MFYTAPELAWQALLKTAPEYCEHEAKSKDCELYLDEFHVEVLRDIDMLMMFEKCIWGRITQARKRYTKANNNYMKDQYNPDATSVYLRYLEANNIYGWAVIQKLPTHWLAWEKVDDFTYEKNRKAGWKR